jgi:methyl-accepting chemotaxis protein
MLFFQQKSDVSQFPSEASNTNSSQKEPDRFDSGYLQQARATLRLQQDRLNLLAGSTESEFLAIGAQLQDFYSRTVQISDVSSTVTEKIGGKEIKNAIRELGSIIDRMEGLLNLMESEAEQSSMMLRKTLQMIAGVGEPLAGFKKIMKVLHVLGISTKIESARLGHLGAGFNNLAEDVRNLAVQINDKSSRIINENVTLSCKINETLGRMDNIEADQRGDVRLSLDKTRTSLELITGVHQKCSEVAVAISAASGKVSRSLSEVVTSLQFHDITRQQLEHVQEAFGDLEDRLAAATVTNNDKLFTSDSDHEIACELLGVCRLQSAQLLHARDGLTAAVSGIVENLRSLAEMGRGIAWQTKEMLNVADGAGDSLFIEIERSLTPVVGLLAKSAEANYHLACAVDSVAKTVEEISSFVIDIETIGEEIKLIALNSQIKAAWTGEEGAALGVLAEAIQRLSVDACDQTSAVTFTLREITRATATLSDGIAVKSHTGEVDAESMAGCLKELIESLRTINDEVMATLEQSDAAAQELSNDIEGATGEIIVQKTVADEVKSITAELELVMAHARNIVPEAASIDLTELSKRYTMHSERKIHAALAGSVADMPETTAQCCEILKAMSSGEDSELGDNIELF